MGGAFLDALPMALAIALFPVPIIAMVLILTSDRGRLSGSVFALGWIAGLSAVGTVVLVLADSAGPSEAGSPADWISWLKLALAAVLGFLGWKQIRPTAAPEAKSDPAWMARLESLGPARAGGLGTAFAALNPKNLLLAVAGATEIAQADLPAPNQVATYAAFVVCATLGIAVPLAISVVLGARGQPILERLRDGLSRHMATIVAVLCGLIALKLAVEAVRDLTS
jgi:threonine/homoserine/homoserine lactone efflux protein